jgi:hypothetical protein
LWVEDPDDAPRARSVVDEFLRSSSSGPAIVCAKCNEENPPAFDFCWSCGATLPR